ncbi:MAG: small ribosomal subunit biogenesis GTPase RsgA [Pseudomonadota bacterium]
MGRKLNRHQAWRAEKIQQDRVRRAQRRDQAVKTAAPPGELGSEESGLVIANFGVNLIVEGDSGARLRCVVRQNLGGIVCGDRVVLQATGDGSGVVIAVLPRRSVLARPDFGGDMKPIAANIDQIVIVIAIKPGIEPLLIDQYLVAAELVGIQPLIVVNKADLLTMMSRRDIDPLLDEYREIGYDVVKISIRDNSGLEVLAQRLRNRTNVLVGHSGVGKSSIAKALLPDIDVRIGELSAASGLGMHTTTAAMLYHLAQGGHLIDSPGIRSFGLWNVSPRELAMGFREFRPYLGHCRFRDCTHRHEPDCALIAASAAEKISAQRLENFYRLLDMLRS